jgi:peptide/nickel transport system ATP-binding protein
VCLPEPTRIYASFPHQLSGGQRQRIVIAITLKPRLRICDEPTTALGVATQAEIPGQAEQGTAVLSITHDPGVVAEFADDVMAMHKGPLVEHGSANQVLRHPRARCRAARPCCKGPVSARPTPAVTDWAARN